MTERSAERTWEAGRLGRLQRHVQNDTKGSKQ